MTKTESIRIKVIGEDTTHNTLLETVLAKQKRTFQIIGYQKDTRNLKKFLPFKDNPHVFVLMGKDETLFSKHILEIKEHHPEIPILVFGNQPQNEFSFLAEGLVHAYLVSDQHADYPLAIQNAYKNQHYASIEFWKLLSKFASKDDFKIVVNTISHLNEEEEKLAKALTLYPKLSYPLLAKKLLTTEDVLYKKLRKLWIKLGLNGKRHLTQFLLAYYSKNG